MTTRAAAKATAKIQFLATRCNDCLDCAWKIFDGLSTAVTSLPL